MGPPCIEEGSALCVGTPLEHMGWRRGSFPKAEVVFFSQGNGKKVAEQQTSPQRAKGKGETHTQSVADGLVLVHGPGVLVSDQRRRESERKLSETLTAISHCCGIYRFIK